MNCPLGNINWPFGQARMAGNTRSIDPTQTQKVWGYRHNADSPKLNEM